MTLTAGPTISFANVNTEVGSASTANLAMSWIKTVTKPVNTVNSMNSLYNLAYFASTKDGNCNNGNCTNNCNCGNIACTNCFINGTVNCVNCDAGTSYLQTNCNCACTYNCTYAATASWNCNCNCDVCACACSDPQLKQNVATIPNPLEAIAALNGKFYNWTPQAKAYGINPDNSTGGLMADEVEKVLPNLVFNYNGMKSVAYEGIVAVLVEAVKSLSKELNELKGRK